MSFFDDFALSPYSPLGAFICVALGPPPTTLEVALSQSPSSPPVRDLLSTPRRVGIVFHGLLNEQSLDEVQAKIAEVEGAKF
jgi:hypothetical protein